ncbi:MAG: hypothetical protein JNM67_01475 [Bacteroidetes bacterium]|nr:hypothetical protein [Bacteroidota bacterium]
MFNQEKPFRSVFDHYKSEPDPEVWSGIKKELIEKKRKKMLFLYSVIFAFVALSLSLFHLKPNSDTAVAGSNTGKVLTYKTDSIQDSFIDEDLYSENLSNAKLNVLNQAATSHNPTQNNQREFLKMIPFIESDSAIGNIQSSSGTFDSTLINFSFEPRVTSVNNLKPFIYVYDLGYSSSRNLKHPQPRPYKYYYELNAGFGSSTFINRPNEKLSLDLNSVQLAINAGLIRRKHEWKLGLKYNFYSDRSVHQWRSVDVFTDSMLIKRRYTSELIQHYYEDTLITDKNDAFINTMHQIRIPLTYQRNWKLTPKMDVYMLLNTSLDYIFASQINTSFSSKYGVRMDATPQPKSYSRTAISIGLGLGGMYKLSKNMCLTYGIESNYQSLGLKSENNTYYWRSTMFNLGLRKLFY